MVLVPVMFLSRNLAGFLIGATVGLVLAIATGYWPQWMLAIIVAFLVAAIFFRRGGGGSSDEV